MASRARTPSQEAYGSVPPLNSAFASRGYGTSSVPASADYPPTAGNAIETSPLAQSFQGNTNTFSSNRYEDMDDDRGSSLQQLEGAGLHRTASMTSKSGTPSRSNTLRKQKSLTRKTSLKRSGSRKSLQAGSIKGVSADDRKAVQDYNNVFYTPVPTTGAPTEILANRFQGMFAESTSLCLEC
jgi:hypothetical protein